MIESVGSAAWRPSVQSDTETARVGMKLRDSRPIARCHPDRELWAAGLCEDCFAARDRDRALQSQKALTGSPMARRGHRLSPREEEVLLLIAKGRTNKQLAFDLGISEQTAKNHMSSILRKTGASDRTQAVLMFLDGKRTEESAVAIAQRNVATIEEALLGLRGSIDTLLVELRAASTGEPRARAGGARRGACRCR